MSKYLWTWRYRSHTICVLSRLLTFSTPSPSPSAPPLRLRPAFLSLTFFAFFFLPKHFFTIQKTKQPTNARTTTTMAPTAHIGTEKGKYLNQNKSVFVKIDMGRIIQIRGLKDLRNINLCDEELFIWTGSQISNIKMHISFWFLSNCDKETGLSCPGNSDLKSLKVRGSQKCRWLVT